MESSLYGICVQLPNEPAFIVLFPTSYAEARERAIQYLSNQPLYQLQTTVHNGYETHGRVIIDIADAFSAEPPSDHIKVVLRTNWYEDVGRLYRHVFLFSTKSHTWENLQELASLNTVWGGEKREEVEED